MSNDDFYKENPTDKIWWKKTDQIGVWEFSFDKKTVYNMFRDYPHNMTTAQVAIFDREKPFWANFFKDRKR